MTRALGEHGPATEAGLLRLAREIQLLAVLELAADQAQELHGASRLVIDRSVHTGSAHISAVFGDTDLVDLWDLDPLLWDDANWAAMQYVPAGGVEIVDPPQRG